MDISKFKETLYNSKIQIIEVSSEGKIIQSDNTLFNIPNDHFISDTHPFFEAIVPLFETVSEKVHFPCVNLNMENTIIIADVDVLHQEGKIYVLVFDFTEHYNESQPLVQEKNEASILKNKLGFERDILVAKEELKNKFLAHLNHEIRNPLNNLLGFMEILEKTKLNYEQKEALNVMNKTGTHLKVLLDDLLDISKIEKGVTELKNIPFSLTQITNSLLKHFQLKYDTKTVALLQQIDKNVPTRLSGDPTRLNQILFNLIENAFKNTKEGSISITISLKKMVKETATASLLFTITDTGKGIHKDDLPYIFDSYHQLEFAESGPMGEGLGLKIVKELTKVLNGTIKIESAVGEGTTYQITLPFVVREKKKHQKKSVPKGTGIVLSKRILVVENEKINQMLIMKTFLDNDDGFLIDIAKDGAQALEILEKRKYNLVLLKSMLPDMTGNDLILKIRTNANKALNEIPILVVSGSSMKEEQENTLKAGASSFLSKPYTKKELFSRVDSLMR
ncbi:ATP-binding response regulator [Ulvibacter litoralis]|uniref:histidine kinase n=1 Tax=Ulvibacter litoralis TaxID=227084 RepID=A0A1G7DKY7_9FLAO|nr:ATP-binding protein [Ulvibacter litoralis]GHC43183.1 hypothetical protein GCM10008083_01900 [Ulvibacter litoralis]SDE51720.1 His Kinase A (phospho-acceptor) domain-containing protein [Ulvibacter litoralis]